MAQKKMKDIFTNEMGQILFPGQPTVIQSRKISPGTDITMKNTKPQIALTPYGAAQMSPNQNYSFAGNTVVELPMAQMGAQAGGDDQQAQIMQIIQMYAQLKGVDPNQLIQELQALPQEEQQKSFELMIGEVQTAMAQQQQQQQGMSQQDMQAAQQMQEQQAMGMPMARKGGLMNPSPQAQDLEWFYRKARNGGLLKAQDQGNINLYDRVLADRNNFMSGPKEAWMSDPALVNPDGSLNMCLDCTNVDYQNKQDALDAARLINEGISRVPEYTLKELEAALKEYNIPMPVYGSAKGNSNMKADPQQKRNGGLTMHQLKGVVDSMVKDAVQRYMSGGEAFPQANRYPEQWAGYNGTQYAEGGEPCIDCFDKYNPSPQAQTYLPYDRKGEKRPNFMFMDGGSKDEFGGQPDLDSIYRMMRSGGLAVNAKKKRGESLSPEEFQEYLSGGSLKEFQGLTQSTTGNTMTGFAPMKFPTSTFMNLNRDEVLIDGKTPDQAVDAFGKRLKTITDQGKEDMFKYQGLTEDEKRIAQIQERANESQPTGLQSWSTTGELRNAMSSAGDTTQSNTTTTQDKKQGTARYKAYPGLHPASYLAAATKATAGKGSLLGLIADVGTLVSDFASRPMAGNRAYGVNPYQSAFDNYRNNITRSSPKQPDTDFSAAEAGAAASASPKTSTNQSVTDDNVNDFINAGNKRFDRAWELKKMGVVPGDDTFYNSPTKPAGDYTSAGTFGPTSSALDKAIWSGYTVGEENEEKAEEESISKAYDILNNSDKYSPEEIAKANEIIDARINDWSSENASQFNISGGPQLTTGPREYRKGGKKKALPKAQFALPGDVTAAGVAGPASSAMNTVGQMRAQQLAAPGALEEFDSENQGPVATPSAGAPLAKGPQMEPITIAPMRTISSVTPTSPTPEPQVQMSSQDLGPAGLSNRQIRQEDRSNRREARQDWRDFKKTDEYKDIRKQQRKDFWEDPNAHFDHAKAARMVGATQGIADFFRVGNQEYMEDQLKKMGTNTSATLGVSQNKDRGDFMANTGRFRPDDYVEAQDAGRSMTDQTSFYNTFNQMYNAKLGGRILDFLEDGGVYELDEDTIRLIMEAGGSVEYI